MYVALEGIDGVGKSTQITLLQDEFKEALFCFEPGYTALGKELRSILLEKNLKLGKRAEFLLFLSDRSELCEEILLHNQNKLIISDRSCISGFAYALSFFDIDELFALNSFALQGFFPQKCVFLRANKSLFLQRNSGKRLDMIEKRGLEYFMQIQNNYEKVLEFLGQKINLQSLILDTNTEKKVLFERIKEFINA